MRSTLQRWVATGMLCLSLPYAAHAQAIPSSVDPARINKRDELRQVAPSPDLTPTSSMQMLPSQKAPSGSEQVEMVLNKVTLKGMTAFTPAEMNDIYQADIGKTITVDKLWTYAQKITERYYQSGYFLSHAVVPQQEIADGNVEIKMVEGYIGEVTMRGELSDRRIVQSWLEELKAYRPLTMKQIEHVLLQLNDLPGLSLRAVLEPIKQPMAFEEGAVHLVLEPREDTPISAHVSFDNNGSKFLGPYQLSSQVQSVILPMQRTTITGLTAFPSDELKYGSIRQEIPIFPAWYLELSGSYARAAPSFTLTPSEIRSKSTELGIALSYQLLRQRNENLKLKMVLEALQTDSTIIGFPLTKDHVRTARLEAAYEMFDRWKGINAWQASVTQGLDMLGSSSEGDPYLSRGEASPDFTKLQMTISRSQPIDNWDLLTIASGQIASGPLYSSEEFGYGGQVFGRAYDDSEITGDHGISALVELRYNGLNAWGSLRPIPYLFYDIGVVWNFDAGQDDRASGSSAGFGLRLASDYGFNINLGAAFPLTKKIDNPILGNREDGPRVLLQAIYNF